MWDHIVENCDKDESSSISWKEARACGAPKEWKAKFLKVAGTDGLVDEEEFLEAAKDHVLAQKKGGKGPSPKEIVEECDKDGSDGVSKAEALACVKKHFPQHLEEAKERIDEIYQHVD